MHAWLPNFQTNHGFAAQCSDANDKNANDSNANDSGWEKNNHIGPTFFFHVSESSKAFSRGVK